MNWWMLTKLTVAIITLYRYRYRYQQIESLSWSNPLKHHGLQHARLSVHHQLLELAQMHVHRISDAIQPSHLRCPLLFPSSIFPSIRVFSNVSTLCIRWPKYWMEASASVLPMDIQSWFHLGLTDWFDLLAVQRTLKSLLQHNSSKVSILWCSAIFVVQLSYLYMTTWKTIALTIQTFVGKVMSLIFNTLSRFVISFLSRSKHLLISWLQSPPKIKFVTASTFPLSICHEVMGQDAIILVFLCWVLSQLVHSPLSPSFWGEKH